jgi:phosphatidate phosphatase LPIN
MVEQPDGSIKSSPFYVRFGKFQLLSSTDKILDVIVNGKVTGVTMKLGSEGEAYFVNECK